MQKINIQELTAVFISNKTRKSEIQRCDEQILNNLCIKMENVISLQVPKLACYLQSSHL
jgi:hypothetical protein